MTNPSHTEQAEHGDAGTQPRRRSSTLTFLRDILIIVLIAIVVSFLVKTFLVRSFYIPSASMEHTLEIDDRILVNELVPGPGSLKRGDVVVFADPGGWLPPSDESIAPKSPLSWLLDITGLVPSDSNNHLIKRVIGLPGDEVSCCSVAGQLEVNGEPIDEPYVNLPSGTTAVSDQKFDVTVPKNRLWVMGDNRYDSADSRANVDGPTHGFVPISDVVGRAFVITWPFERWSWLSNYSPVFADVPDRPSTSSTTTPATPVPTPAG